MLLTGLYTLICAGLFYSFVVLDRAAETAMSSNGSTASTSSTTSMAKSPAQITVNEVIVVHDANGDDVFIVSFDVVTPPNSGEYKVRGYVNGVEFYNTAVDFGRYYGSGVTAHSAEVRTDMVLLHFNEATEEWEVVDTGFAVGSCESSSG